MDKLTAAEVEAHTLKDPKFLDKYNRRYRRDDIIEIQEDGFWMDGKRKGFGYPKFVLVLVPGITKAEAAVYLTPETNAASDILKRRQYRVALSNLTVDKNGVAVLNIATDIIDKTKV